MEVDRPGGTLAGRRLGVLPKTGPLGWRRADHRIDQGRRQDRVLYGIQDRPRWAEAIEDEVAHLPERAAGAAAIEVEQEIPARGCKT